MSNNETKIASIVQEIKMCIGSNKTLGKRLESRFHPISNPKHIYQKFSITLKEVIQ